MKRVALLQVCALALGHAAALSGPMTVEEREPARFRFQLFDAAGNPATNAALTVISRRSEFDLMAPRRYITDGMGNVQWQTHLPKSSIAEGFVWEETVNVDFDGQLPFRSSWTAFPGADFRERITLTSSHSTVIHVRDPNGNPMAHAVYLIRFTKNGSAESVAARLNGRGEYLFVHEPLPQGFSLTRGTWKRELKDRKSVTVELTEEEMSLLGPLVGRAKSLRLRLWTADGAPAMGWLVAPNPMPVASFGAIPGPMCTRYQAGPVLPLGLDGTVEFRQAEHDVVILSPEGIPFRFPVHPGSWTNELRRVTLRLPAVRRTHWGKLRFEDGRPAANVPLGVHRIRSDSTYWDLQMESVGGHRAPALWQAAPGEGWSTGTMSTDSKGEYQIPLYFGVRVEFQLPLPLWATPRDILSDTNVVLSSRSIARAKDFRTILLRIVDETGREIDGMHVWPRKGYTHESKVVSGGHACRDSRGWHLFVKTNDLQTLSLSLQSSGWSDHDVTIAMSEVRDGRVTVTIPNRLRLLPVKGRVLKPDGDPLVGARVLLRADSGDRSYLRPFGWTDEGGRFRFDTAPDACLLELDMINDEGDREWVPGWFEPPHVSRHNRDVLLVLKPAGSVRFTLPEELPAPPKSRNVVLAAADSALPESLRYWPSYEKETGTLFEPYVRPGRYRLTTYDPKPWRNISNIAVTVRAGEETVVNLMGQKYLPLELKDPPRVWTEVWVKYQGRPVSGAVVRSVSPPGGRDFNVQADLSDDEGRVRFSSEQGRELIIVARAPGRFVGWTTVTGQTNGSVKLAVVRSASLDVQGLVESGENPLHYACTVQLPEVPHSEAWALLWALGLGGPNGFPWNDTPAPGLLIEDRPFRWVADDFPVNLTCQVQIRRHGDVVAEQDVTLDETGPAARVIQLAVEAGKVQPAVERPKSQIIDPATGLPLPDLLTLPER